MKRNMPPVAIVMNMFYTGLGISRSLGEHGIPVIGLTAHRGIYGNFTRYAKLRTSPDSREEPELLLAFLLRLADELGDTAVIFPTRDDDVRFLDRYREQLGARFTLAVAERGALEACLDKQQTFLWAQKAAVASPRTWSITGIEDLHHILPELPFPCIMKPVSAHHWRQGSNWQVVGNRKAVPVPSPETLLTEYNVIAQAENRALLQEMVPGGDDCLFVAACYLNRQSELIAGFTAQKLLQVPERFGTGCILQTVDRPELLVSAGRLLRAMGFSGIAEVEFKWDSNDRQFKLIEVNPRAWDQHRLGNACGVDLVHVAYCDLLGLDRPLIPKQGAGQKWIADDVFFLLLLRSLWKREGKLRSYLRLAAGQRTYAIWSIRDPLPLLGFIATRFIPQLVKTISLTLLSFMRRLMGRKKGSIYENHLEKANCKN